MFSVGELAKRFGVSRQTIYNKVATEELKPYVIDNNGAKLTSSGLDVLTALLADGKAGQQVAKKFERQRQDEVDNKGGNPDKYTSLLEQNIKELKQEIQDLKTEKQGIQAKYDAMVERVFSFEQKLLESKQDKEKRTFLQWFGMKK